MKEKLFIYSPELEEGGYPADCPFNTHRPGRVRQTLVSMGLLEGSDRGEAPSQPLSDEELRWYHTEDYLAALDRAGRGDLAPLEALQYGLGTPDCPIFKDMLPYNRLSAGGTVTGARAILEDGVRFAFNPAGGFHHAMPANAAGFCYLNDVVLGAMVLADAGKHVLFLDIDVHHCDGVEHAFYERPDVMTVSMHESGKTLFPGTGAVEDIGRGAGRGYTVNIPLPVGTHDAIYRKAFRTGVLPLMEAFDPDAIMIEIGMDALAGDPLAHLHLTNNTHADILGEVMQLGKPIVATGGGGYNVENTVRGWALCWSVFCGDQQDHDDLMIGMGGVMMESTEWSGGLRDRVLLADGGRRREIDAEIEGALEFIKRVVFPVHGL